MSNYRAVAAVTQALRYLLTEAIKDRVPEAIVTTVRPEEQPEGLPKNQPRINIYLFQVIPNASLRNADLPTRGASGAIEKRPQAAINLNYIFSFYGNEKLAGQLLLGIATTALHAFPILTPDLLQSANEGGPGKGSGILQQDVEVRLAPLTLDLEELAKFWSCFQVPFTLSTTYQASVVLLAADLLPQRPLPVRSLRTPSLAGPIPHITAIQPARLVYQQGAVVNVRGSAFPGTDPVVRVGDVLIDAEVSRQGTELRFTLPERAGLLEVRVGRRLPSGDDGQNAAPASDRRDVTPSNAVSLAVQPKVEAIHAAHVEVPGTDDAEEATELLLTVDVAPPIGGDQEVGLSLNEYQPNAVQPRAYTFAQRIHSSTSRLVFPISGVATGVEYLVRVTLDGQVSSPLEVDAKGFYSQPRVLIPSAAENET